MHFIRVLAIALGILTAAGGTAVAVAAAAPAHAVHTVSGPDMHYHD